MSTQPATRKITAFLLLAVGLMLACGVTSTAPTSAPPGFDATKVSLEIQGTAMVLQLTQTALALRLQQPGAPGAPALTPQALPLPAEGQPTYTATVTTVIRLDSQATEISYGEKLGSYPRKTEGVLWGFKGIKGDTVTILLESSNARPNEPACSTLRASTTFILRTPNTEIPATLESPHLSSMRDYVLPATGAYYVSATCTGTGCNGHCTEADLSLEKK